MSRYVQHPRHRLIPGGYTDETQMNIAIAQVIISQSPWTRDKTTPETVNFSRQLA